MNFEKKLGAIKPMHAVGQAPLLGINTERFRYLKEANIPYSRLHDVGGWFGGNMFVDIPNIFRDFDADVNDPESYDFTYTDIIIKGLVENNCEPIYRLGVTIENFAEIKPYRIFPPKDMKKWAVICEHIIRHYNEGWADGFYYGIKYWEIWNEPDGHRIVEKNTMWRGTKEEFFELYKTTSLHLRNCFGEAIKIGGFASCGFYKIKEKQDVTGAAFGVQKELTDWDIRINYFIEFFEDFVAFVKAEELPFDFFSYHSYSSVKDNIKMQSYAEKYLEDAGFGNVEIHLNEWNTNTNRQTRGTSLACSSAVALMCAMQNMKMSMMCYYDARIAVSPYGGLFNPLTLEPFCTYYGFKAFGKLYALGTQVECSTDGEDLYALAASDGKTGGIVISNLGEGCEINIPLKNNANAYLIDEDNCFAEIKINENSVVLEKNQVIYIETIL